MRIAREFRYDVSEDEKGAELLDSLLVDSPDKVLDRLRTLLSGRNVIVNGGALSDTDMIPDGPLIATGSSVEMLKRSDATIDVVVTDLDKDAQAQLDACSDGAIPIIHAHGDNTELISEWIPKFIAGSKGMSKSGSDEGFHEGVLGTCQTKPVGNLVNFGGFTDGDRAVHLALELGAERCTLIGFDFENADDNKIRKLRWAEQLISMVGDKVEMIQ